MPNAYLLGIDYAAKNYDYQDDLYLITNITPETGFVGVPPTPINDASSSTTAFSLQPISLSDDEPSEVSKLIDSVG